MDVGFQSAGQPSSGRRLRRSAPTETRRRHPRRWLLLAPALLCLAAVVDLPLAYLSSTAAGASTRSLEATLDRYQAEGLSSAQLAPIRHQLSQLGGQPWWSPAYWLDSPEAQLGSARSSSRREWTEAVSSARASARGYLAEYRQLLSRQGVWLSLAETTAAAGWSSQLAAARTPIQLRRLAARFGESLAGARSDARSNLAAALAAVPLSTSDGLLAEATQLESEASAAGLAAGPVAGAAQSLRQAQAGGKPSSALSATLSARLARLREEVALKLYLTNLDHSTMALVDQAAFEEVPGWAGFSSSYAALHRAFSAASSQSQLASVELGLDKLGAQVSPVLAADRCGHSSYAGKSIYVSLSLQEEIFYDQGCAVMATPVTTGRPQLPTPTGTYHIFLKQSPVWFISSYPKSSPFYYSPVLVQYAMEFLTDGYYIHSAQWETTDDFGPGSEDVAAYASHGCVHTPTSVMAWAYAWTPIGTPVVISA